MLLSSSRYGGPRWKQTALDTAKMIMEVSPRDELLSAKWKLRAQVLSRLYPGNNFHKAGANWTAYQGNLILKADPSWTAYQGNLILFDVQNLIFNGDLDNAWKLLEQLDSMLGTSSAEERIRYNTFLFKSKVCRLQGNFSAALKHLEILEGGLDIYKGLIPNYRSQLIELYCELGRTSDAAAWNPSVDVTSISWLNLRTSGRRVSLAVAGTYFMEGCHMLVRQKTDFSTALKSLNTARKIYEVLERSIKELAFSRITLFREFSVSIGLAMITHLECYFQSIKFDEAYECWDDALVIAGKMRDCCGWQPGFAEMIITFSKSEIAYRSGNHQESVKLVNEGKVLYQRTGRQFSWFALGTVWFDVIGDWLVESGYSRIDKPLDDWRM